jgi:glycerophosphoryl diester phosphodiesterase
VIRKHKLESRCIVQSFDFRTLHAMKRLAPEIRLSALWEGAARPFLEIAREAEAPIVSPAFHLVTPEQVQLSHAANLQVVPWTADTPRDWQRLIDAGVDAIITDDPAELIAYLKQRGLR